MSLSSKHPLKWIQAVRFYNQTLQNKGFTITELMIVLAILAILAAFAAPLALQWKQNKRLGGSARDFYSSMQQAKLAAIKNNANVGLIINPALGQCQMFLDNGGPTGLGTRNDGFLNGDEQILATRNMPVDVVMLVFGGQFSGTNTPVFTSRAIAMIGRAGTVVFQSIGRTDRWYRVVLAPSGQLTLQMSTNSTDGQDGTWVS